MVYYETTSGALLSNAQAVTATADSTNVFDVTGAGSGTAPAMIGGGGLNTAMGTDLGSGVEGVAVPQVLITIVTPTTVTGGLSFTLKAAPDDGSYGQGTYTTLYKSATLTGTTQLAAGAQYIIPVPPVIPGEAIPRFYKLTYTVESGSISATITAVMLFNAPNIRQAKLFGENYTVAS